MAQFYASIQDQAGPATRMGSKSSGIEGHVRGWNVGARVVVTHEDGHDVVRVYRTSGSNGGSTDELLAEFTEDGR
jgi:hypothetical protein